MNVRFVNRSNRVGRPAIPPGGQTPLLSMAEEKDTKSWARGGTAFAAVWIGAVVATLAPPPGESEGLFGFPVVIFVTATIVGILASQR